MLAFGQLQMKKELTELSLLMPCNEDWIGGGLNALLISLYMTVDKREIWLALHTRTIID